MRQELPALSVRVRGYSDQLEQVLINLMVNARDALLGRQAEVEGFLPWIAVAARLQGNRVCLFVEDNGGGIAPPLLTRIFEPFFTTKPIGKGTGLGLSVSHGIVQQMGGDFSVENAEHGARFCISLPLEDSC
ncbi:Sensor protein ZraS [compost metagenome]